MSNWFRTYGFADVLDGLVIGAYPLDETDVSTLSWMGIKRVLNLTEDDEYRRGERETVARALVSAGIEEYRLGLTDYGGLPAAALEEAVQEVNAWLDEGTVTYLHCRAGWQRSAAVAAGSSTQPRSSSPPLITSMARRPCSYSYGKSRHSG